MANPLPHIDQVKSDPVRLLAGGTLAGLNGWKTMQATPNKTISHGHLEPVDLSRTTGPMPQHIQAIRPRRRNLSVVERPRASLRRKTRKRPTHGGF